MARLAKLDRGYWHGEDAWVLLKFAGERVLLVGGHTEEEAQKVRSLLKKDQPLGDYEDYVVYADREEWKEQNEY